MIDPTTGGSDGGDEMPATALDDPASIARHEKAVALYRAKAEECGNDNVWRLG